VRIVKEDAPVPGRADGTEIISVTGYWALRYHRHSPLAKYKFDWPSGKLVVRDGALIFDANEPFGRLYRLIGNRAKTPIPIVVPLEKINGLRVRDDWLGYAIVLSDDPTFERLRFGASRGRFRRVIASLESMGVAVER
jgi:hypothetical protein